MDIFLQNIFLFPTAIFTLLIGFMGVYWVFVMMGVMDLEIFDVVDGAVDVGTEGLFEAAEGADAPNGGDGLLDGMSAIGETPFILHSDIAPELVLQGTFDKLLDKQAISADEHIQLSKRQGLSLRVVPLSISLSLILVFSWMLSYVGSQFADLIVPTNGILSGTLIVMGSVLLSSLFTAILIRPFGGTFVTHESQTNSDLIGEIAEIISPNVDSNRGEIRVVDKSGIPLQLQARYDRDHNLLRGETAMVIHFDKARNACIVEPMNSPLGLAIRLRKDQLHQMRRQS